MASDPKSLCLKMKSDYRCYLSAFKTGAEMREATESTLVAYKISVGYCSCGIGFNPSYLLEACT
uniref:Uncharacterized protein n=1 Tax=Vitis vinifera TaxID=29760 RepID=F6I077_VITVI